MTPPASRPLIVPSVLPADFANLGEACRQLEKAGADRIQWDIMDGRFVPNLTFGPDTVASCRPLVELPFEAHLMVDDPDRLLPRWVDAGCATIIVHAEAATHLHRTLQTVRGLGVRAGVAINPATPLSLVEHVIDLVDLLLIMTVNPGFGGQAYLASQERKIAAARGLLDAAAPERNIELEVDGGITTETIDGAAQAGARTFCAGSALFRAPRGLESAVAELRRRAEEAIR
ncbi:ribulose-phosphate 3-epimerase [Allosalinactinospora lopnorensis]|uniref:ribulose-phosphate 3-epimerase n=1 Tax=Allosalinactinospora lopnorensis TaxID=1352348 RepID=UPI000623BBEE|nr:ribulose-phosphate 3-epimerase [Allosalinactinospora lopnorensis]